MKNLHNYFTVAYFCELGFSTLVAMKFERQGVECKRWHAKLHTALSKTKPQFNAHIDNN